MNDVVTIAEFAQQYRVREETVRWWVRTKRIPYVLINGRKMVKKSEALKVVEVKDDDPIV